MAVLSWTTETHPNSLSVTLQVSGIGHVSLGINTIYLLSCEAWEMPGVSQFLLVPLSVVLRTLIMRVPTCWFKDNSGDLLSLS